MKLFKINVIFFLFMSVFSYQLVCGAEASNSPKKEENLSFKNLVLVKNMRSDGILHDVKDLSVYLDKRSLPHCFSGEKEIYGSARYDAKYLEEGMLFNGTAKELMGRGLTAFGDDQMVQFTLEKERAEAEILRNIVRPKVVVILRKNSLARAPGIAEMKGDRLLERIAELRPHMDKKMQQQLALMLLDYCLTPVGSSWYVERSELDDLKRLCTQLEISCDDIKKEEEGSCVLM